MPGKVTREHIRIEEALEIGASGEVILGRFHIDNARNCRCKEINYVTLRRIKTPFGNNTLFRGLVRRPDDDAIATVEARVSRPSAPDDYRSIRLDENLVRTRDDQPVGVDTGVFIDAARVDIVFVAKLPSGPLMQRRKLIVECEAIVEARAVPVERSNRIGVFNLASDAPSSNSTKWQSLGPDRRHSVWSRHRRLRPHKLASGNPPLPSR